MSMTRCRCRTPTGQYTYIDDLLALDACKPTLTTHTNLNAINLHPSTLANMGPQVSHPPRPANLWLYHIRAVVWVPRRVWRFPVLPSGKKQLAVYLGAPTSSTGLPGVRVCSRTSSGPTASWGIPTGPAQPLQGHPQEVSREMEANNGLVLPRRLVLMTGYPLQYVPWTMWR